MLYNQQRAKQLLCAGTNNPDARFRDGQEEEITHIIEGKGRLLLVQKTGWGKSSVYFIATKLLREAGAGPALLISPLIALMRNQLFQAELMGVRARTIHSDNKEDWADIEEAITMNEVDILLISPERLANEHFRTEVLAKISAKIALLIIDEAHCVSDWGHDFRPHYRLIERILRNLPANMRLLATTATANNRVMADLEKVLGPNLIVSRGDLNRPSLRLQTIKLQDQSERLAWLAGVLPKIEGSGIIYTLTVHDAERVAGWLKSRGINVEAYTSETGERREQLENALLQNQIKALVATTALGMGFDKPDLSFVIHYQTPGSVIAYYQQVGRAGRAIDSAYGVLLSGQEDLDITNYFIENAFPTREEVKLVLEALQGAPHGLSIPELLSKINVSYGRIEKALSMLFLESPAPVIKQGSKWQLTTSTLSGDFWERAERLTILRHEEQQQMQEYVQLRDGHMEFLIKALDGDTSNIQQNTIPALSADVDPELVIEATVFLRRTNIPIEPRLRWPSGGLPHLNVSGIIKSEYQAHEGRALCNWGDAGFGKLVKRGKYTDNHYADELVAACAELYRNWKPNPAPNWVTCIPSRRHPELVPDFAQRLAKSLALPFYNVLEKTDDRPQQKTMANSSQQAINVDGSLVINVDALPDGPVLLVDDMVDSRWTFDIAAYLLRLQGSGVVFPLALAYTGHGE
jgi:ATP-dependent DNA helicase RecQ